MSLVLLCPGQGGQHPAMFARLQDAPAADDVLAAAACMLGDDPRNLAADPGRYANRIAQPLVCAGALAHWQALRTRLPAPVLVAGYSVGELAAHAVAGSLCIDDCLGLARERAASMDAASPTDGGLLAIVGLREPRVEGLCDVHACSVAIVNGDDHIVVGGRAAGLDAIAAEAEGLGARCVRIPVCVPAHTPLLAQAAKAFADALARTTLRTPRVRLLAGIDGRPVGSPERLVQTLSAQISSTVHWQQVIDQAIERGGRVFLELGPGAALARMLQQSHPQVQARSVDDFQSLDGVVGWVHDALERMR